MLMRSVGDVPVIATVNIVMPAVILVLAAVHLTHPLALRGNEQYRKRFLCSKLYEYTVISSVTDVTSAGH